MISNKHVNSEKDRLGLPTRTGKAACGLICPMVIFAAVVFLITGLTGCSSSSDSGGTTATSSDTTTTGGRDVSALTLPDRVSLTQESDTTSSAGLTRGAQAYNDTGTDYSNQEKQTWVDDNTDALSMVNEILDVMGQTNYSNFVNYGPYKALVKKIEESGKSQGGATTSSTTTEQYQEITLNVTRETEDSPMYVNIWLEEEEGPGENPMLIRGRFIVTREAGEGYPYGELEAHFKGNMLGSDGSVGTELFQMAISVGVNADGQVAVQYVEDMEEGDNFAENRKARILANSDLTEGNAYVYNYRYENFGMEPNTSTSTSYVAFNEDYFKMQEVGGDTAVFDKNDLAHRIFRYKLYLEDTGALVTRSSGFPIQLSDGTHAYVGYYGLWAPHGVEIEEGDTVTRVDSDTTYTVVKKRGVLRKHTAAQITLADLVGTEMSYWNEGTDAIIAWDGSSFNVIGTRNNENGQIEYAAGDAVVFEEWGGAWCEQMSSYLPLGRLYKDDQGESTTPTNASVIKYHNEETVSPGEVSDMTLYFGEFTLDLPITNEVIAGAQEAQEAFWQSQERQLSTYFFDASELVLKATDTNGEAVLFPAGLTISEGSNFNWGYHMMPLVTNDEITIENWWQAHDETVYYSWQTGNDQWQHFTTLVDSDGSYVAFEPPIRMTYTHANANDVNWSSGDSDVKSNGEKFNIDYDGFELQIPWKFDPDEDDWAPMFNLADGTTLSSGSTNYIVKGIEEALVMRELDSAPAAAASLVIVEIDPPTLVYDSTVTDQVGDPSTVADAEIPAAVAGAKLLVIGGETVQ